MRSFLEFLAYGLYAWLLRLQSDAAQLLLAGEDCQTWQASCAKNILFRFVVCAEFNQKIVQRFIHFPNIAEVGAPDFHSLCACSTSVHLSSVSNPTRVPLFTPSSQPCLALHALPVLRRIVASVQS